MDLANEQQGPLDDSALRRIYALGDIHDFTFCWNEDLPAWLPLKVS